MNESNSGVNTMLLVLLLALVVGGIVWFFQGYTPEEQSNAGIEVSIPTGGENSGSNAN